MTSRSTQVKGQVFLVRNSVGALLAIFNEMEVAKQYVAESPGYSDFRIETWALWGFRDAEGA